MSGSGQSRPKGTNHVTQPQPTSTNIKQRFHSSPAISTAKAQARVLPAATSPNATPPKQNMPSPGGQTSGMTGHQRWRGWAGVDRVGHPADLPPGLPRGDPGAELPEDRRRSRQRLPPGRRVVGLRQADGMPHSPQRARSSVVIRQHKRITTSNTPPHEPTRPKREKIRPSTGRQTSSHVRTQQGTTRTNQQLKAGQSSDRRRPAHRLRKGGLLVPGSLELEEVRVAG